MPRPGLAKSPHPCLRKLDSPSDLAPSDMAPRATAMRRPPNPASAVLLSISVGTLALASLAPQALAQRGGFFGSSRSDPELEHLSYASKTFESEALGRQARYSIYLPKDYDAEANKDTRYPVIYYLHGMNEDHARFHARGGAPILDQAVDKGVLPKLIFVCADDQTRSSFYINGRIRMEDMILKDLIPHIEKTYRARTDRAHRALLGVSMGGFGALKIAFKNPQVFGVVATHSAAILPEEYKDLASEFPWAAGRNARSVTMIFGDPVDEDLWRSENPLTLARKLTRDKLDGLRIHFDCGDQDRYGFQVPNQELHEVLEDLEIPHSWALVPGGTHGWNTRRSAEGYNQSALPKSLAIIGETFASPKKKGPVQERS